jgi:glycosyltransferase involved in cell wall biosynthesis
MSPGTLLFIANVDWFFISHRMAIARAARAAGYAVHVACGLTGREAELRAAGFAVHPLRLSRASTHAFDQLRLAWAMADVIRAVRPDIVHLVTIKPVLIGGAVARLLRVPRVVAAISGLGYVFIANGPLARIKRRIIGGLYRLALASARARVIFQNADDRDLIAGLAGLRPGQIRMIRGSGVDLDRLRPEPLAPGRFCVALASRLLVDKGVREFVAAVALLRARGLDARFVVAGDLDPENPACIPAEEVEAWRREGAVEIVGHIADIRPLFADAHVIALPSYREGMPLVLLEAAACGRAVVTTDVPGCRDAIEPGVSGLLVPVRDPAALADALALLAEDRERCARMGDAGRRLAESAFSLDEVVATHLRIYAEP